MIFDRNVMLYGKPDDLPQTQTVHAGPLTALFENGDLRYIRLGDHEIIRRIYSAVRDHNWATVLPTLSNLKIVQDVQGFFITYDVENKQDDIHFVWRGEITGSADGTIRFAMRGEAKTSFRRNRVGFCILHPTECAGAKARVEHVDGSADETEFPSVIAPQKIVDGMIKPLAPFDEMRVLAHEVTPGVWAELRMEGDVFELEDQRNWLDASYKTYCTPLRLPFPVEVPAGTRIEQTLTLSIRGAAASGGTSVMGESVRLEYPPNAGRLPELGVEMASHGEALTAGQIDRLRALHLGHLRAHLELSEGGWEVKLRRAHDEAQALDVPLEIALRLASGSEVKNLEAAASALMGTNVARVIVLHNAELTTSATWVRLAREHLPGVRIVSGTDANFCELNRERAALPDLTAAVDALTFSTNPQVHAFDNSSLVETLMTYKATTDTLGALAGGKPISISPITFKMRWNPYATAAPKPTPPGVLPTQADVRQMSLFGAAWTLGCLNALVANGISSATLYETTGWRGVMDTDAGSPGVQPRFYSTPGMTYPLYHVLADVGEFAGGEAHSLRSSNPLRAAGLLLRKHGKARLLLANLTPDEQTLVLPALDTAQLRMLDETSFAQAATDPTAFRSSGSTRAADAGDEARITLRAYAVACVDVG